jgi:hypothetical protein
MGVEERHHVAEAVKPVLADDTQQAHAAPEFHGSGACASPIFEHFRFVAVLFKKPAFALFAAIGFGDGLEALGQIGIDFIPRESDEFIGSA